MKHLLHINHKVATILNNNMLQFTSLTKPLSQADFDQYGFELTDPLSLESLLIATPMSVIKEAQGEGEAMTTSLSLEEMSELENGKLYGIELPLQDYYNITAIDVPETGSALVQLTYTNFITTGTLYGRTLSLSSGNLPFNRVEVVDKKAYALGVNNTLWDAPFELLTYAEEEPSYAISYTDLITEIYTTTEVTDAVPNHIVIDCSFNEKTTGENEISFSVGLKDNTEEKDGGIQLTEVYPGYYSGSGVYESPAIDIGNNIKHFNHIQYDMKLPSKTTARVYTATSKDGQTFTPYEAIRSNNTIASPVGRYVKIKIELQTSGDGLVQPIEVKEQDRRIFNSTGLYHLTSNTAFNKLMRDAVTVVQFSEQVIEQTMGEYRIIGYYE